MDQDAQNNLLHWVENHFSIRGITLRQLPGERDMNFCLETAEGQKWLLRLHRPDESPEFLEGQRAAMARLHGLPVPQWSKSHQGNYFVSMATACDDSDRQLTGLLSWLPGKPWGEIRQTVSQLPRDPAEIVSLAEVPLHRELGELLGQLQVRWSGWGHHGLDREFVWDLARANQVIRERQPLVSHEKARLWIDECLRRFDQHVAPQAHQLRRGVVHNDANDYNLLLTMNPAVNPVWSISGLIDFGDMVTSWTVNDLAIAIAYAVLDEPRPLKVAAEIVRGYHQVWPLSEIEVQALWSLVTLRLATSICMAAEQQAARPDDPYLSISQAAISRSLPRILAVTPQLATAYLRWACGWQPLPQAQEMVAKLRAAWQSIQPLLGAPWQAEQIAIIDWSVDSDELAGDPSQWVDQLSRSVDRILQRRGASLGTGAYGEPRLVYAGDQFILDGQPFGQRRTIHLGLDVFAPAGTWIEAPLSGEVVDVAEIEAAFDYGGVVLLKHELNASPDDIASNCGDSTSACYSLYGHLSRASVRRLQRGQKIAAGERFVQLGTPAENGGWPPHLHLQLMAADLGLGLDFPGVASSDEWDFWSQVSLDPNELALLPPECLSPAEPAISSTVARRQSSFGPSQRLSYRTPLHLVRGWRQYLFDHTGRRYLDAYNNVPHVGHAHPHVVEATCRQLQKLNTNTRYLSDVCHNYVEKLLSYFPAPLDTCFLLSSASEANELALRLARTFTQRRDLMVTAGAYHGHTTTLIDISPYKHRGPGGVGAPEWVHEVPLADDYRGPFKRDDPQVTAQYSRLVQAVLERQAELHSPIGAMIVETCPSVAGQIFFPPGYLTEVYRMVRAAGAVMIADEVQTGLGRLGDYFFAFEQESLVPDIVVLGKPLGNGHPLAAVVTRREIATAFDNGMEFFATFGGNTVACAAGLAVLEVLQQEQLPAQAAQVGQWMLAELQKLAAHCPWIGDVRGRGYYLGIELVLDRQERTPAPVLASHIVNQMRSAGILWGVDGSHRNVLKFRPPLCFTPENAAQFLDCFSRILAAY